jgi:hypothetical protein
MRTAGCSAACLENTPIAEFLLQRSEVTGYACLDEKYVTFQAWA